MVLERFMAKHLPGIERELDKCLPNDTVYPQGLHQAMRYSTLGGGKRLRGLLALAATEMVAKDRFGELEEAAYRLAAAVEMVHAYSPIPA
jgi:farnesyl diphosphate synthase